MSRSMIINSFLLILISGLLSTFADECPENAVLGFVDGNKAYCYLYERFPAKFIIAEKNCRTAGGHLASAHNALTNDFIAQFGSEAFEVTGALDFWIGAHNLHNPQKWEWTDGSNFDFTNWLNDDKPKDSCLSLQLNGSWTGVNCFLDKSYVCQIETEIVPTPPNLNYSTKTLELESSTLPQITTKIQQPITTIEPSTKNELTTEKSTTEKLTTVEIQTSTQNLTTIQTSTQNLTTIQTSTKLTTKLPTTTRLPTTKRRTTSCSKGWTYLAKTEQCYKVIKTSENPIGCFQQLGVESSIHSDEENELIGNLAQKQSIFPFDNIKVRLSLIDGKWIDKSKFDYTNWANGEPRKGNKCIQLESCFENSCWLSFNKNVWSTVNCLSSSKYLICTRSY